ncbi:hypothetical protein XENOCAPTIV_010300 [Xenoophorus captivus]|uniref:Uncharacterized protein n=1 Tax=Xenoophorus captivus TaxID=1517983 RepID=A0ABV0S207_9TELE
MSGTGVSRAPRRAAAHSRSLQRGVKLLWVTFNHFAPTLPDSAQRERSPSPAAHNPPTPQSTDSQPALSDTSATTPTAPTPTPKRRRHPDMDCISYQSQSLRRSTRNTSGGDRPAEGSSGGQNNLL